MSGLDPLTEPSINSIEQNSRPKFFKRICCKFNCARAQTVQRDPDGGMYSL